MTRPSTSELPAPDRSNYRLNRQRKVSGDSDEVLDLGRTTRRLGDGRPIVEETWLAYHKLWVTVFMPASGLEKLTPAAASRYLLRQLTPATPELTGPPGFMVFRDAAGHWTLSLTYLLDDLD